MNESSSPALPSAPAPKTRLPLMLAVAIVVLLAHGPMLVLLGRRMWATDHYSFFPLILVGSAIIGWQRYRDYADKQIGVTWDAGFRSPLLWIASIILLTIGVAAHSPWPAGVGFLLALRASMNSLLAEGLARRVMPAWWFLWLAIPLPLNFDRHMILAMQLLATKLASGVLDLGGIRHSLSGVVIALPGKSFFVEEACSGVQSLFAAISVTVFYSMLGRRGFLRTLILMLAGIMWVLVANALRIIAVTVLSTRYQVPIDEGWAHEATGAAVFVVAMLLIVSTDRIMLFLSPLKVRGAFERDEPSSYSARRRRRRRSLSPVWTVPAGVMAVAVFGFLGFVQLTQAVPAKPHNINIDREQEIVNESTLPEEWNGWTRRSFTIIQRKWDDPNGPISRVWQYSRSGQTVSFSLDGPFDVWHDLGLCYAALGWTVENEIDHTSQTDEGPRYDYSQLTQENGEGRHAFVTFSAFDHAGERVAPPPFFRAGVGMRFPSATILLEKMANRLSPKPGPVEQYGGVVYQSQAFLEVQSLLTDAERNVVTDLFQHLTGVLRSRFTESKTTADTADSSKGEG